ncbi:hypothetical protein JNM87_06345 [Candidatus Saccharibacteria bacterium]|nr:hypothetical protein [Candidatus Saccharibacteria bacterium]
MEEQQKQLVAKLKDAQNVLVTVSKNPSVDQLAAAIGMTLAFSKLDKHATAVFSGQTPSTIEFLKPENTLETNTDSLRDFIIALDKAKADKLRYKVEDEMVRIFITPYRNSISQEDLEFSQGDFNVDVVVALGVKAQTDLDDAVQAHGRILHDAVVATISIDGQSELGTINLVNNDASSLCEVASVLLKSLDKDVFDSQIATALLTGIVATTDRFSNERTTPETMSISGVLMSAGANQQLIATELAAPVEEHAEPKEAKEEATEKKPKEPGTLEINHGRKDSADADSMTDTADSKKSDFNTDADDGTEEDEEPETEPESDTPQIQVNDDGQLITEPEMTLPKIEQVHGRESSDEQHDSGHFARERILEPPSMGGMLTANTSDEGFDAASEDLTRPSMNLPLLDHGSTVLPHASSETADPAVESGDKHEPPSLDDSYQTSLSTTDPIASPGSAFADVTQLTPQEPKPEASAIETAPPTYELTPALGEPISADQDTPSTGAGTDQLIDTSTQTLSDIEKVVDSPHLDGVQPQSSHESADANVEDARNAVEAALAAASAQNPEPIVALNAQPLGPELHQAPAGTSIAYQPAPGFPNATDKSDAPDADMMLNMPVPGANSTEPSSGALPSFPGQPSQAQQGASAMPPPPVPPPPIFPTS